jgi:Tol biopolymer transport system component
VHPNIGFADLSPDGAWYAYTAFQGGWAFVEVISTTGGTPRRLTERQDMVYQPRALWSPDGSSLVVADTDFEYDTGDLLVVTWPEGEWRRVTDTPTAFEIVASKAAFTESGEVLVAAQSATGRIMSASVADLLVEDSR